VTTIRTKNGRSKRFKTVHPVYNNDGDAMYYHWKVYPHGHTVVRFEGEVVADYPSMEEAIEGTMKDAIAAFDGCQKEVQREKRRQKDAIARLGRGEKT
jgi:hypothetical protein